jgi:large subunit ribosomal protein L32
MPVPKKRHSRSRQGKRRANWNLVLPSLSKCPSCGAAVLPHQVCPECGSYRGRLVVEAGKEKKAKKEKK